MLEDISRTTGLKNANLKSCEEAILSHIVLLGALGFGAAPAIGIGGGQGLIWDPLF